MISKSIITQACQEVYKKFPQISGTTPEIKKYDDSRSADSNSTNHYLLIFTNNRKTDKNAPIKLWVRVIIDEFGRIIKISTSK